MNFGVIRYKIWRDLWANKSRTLQVVVIIAIGAFAVGTTLGGRELLLKDINRTWLASKPATIAMEVSPPVDRSIINSLGNLRQVDMVEGWQQEVIKWRRGPAEPWQPATLVALDDYEAQTIRQVSLDRGEWPRRQLMGVQRGRGLDVGDRVELEINDKTYGVELNGLLYNAAAPARMASPDPIFFTLPTRFAQLTGATGYGLVLATIPNYSDAGVETAADLLQADLEKQGVEIEPGISAPGGFKRRTGRPDQSPAQDLISGVILILTTLAVTTLILGLFLVYNTINAIIVQQVNQIGAMKAIGARFGQILEIYFSLVLVYALLAVLLAAPLGALGAHILRLVMVRQIGMIPGPFEISTTAVTIQVGLALLSPLLAAMLPVFSGAWVTVREAISTYGLTMASTWLERLLVNLQFLPRVISLIISNTFRNKKQVFFTQMTLVGAGVIFMMVMNTRTSLVYTWSDSLFSIFNMNVILDLKEAQRINPIEALTLKYPGVKTVEMWGAAKGTARLYGRTK